MVNVEHYTNYTITKIDPAFPLLDALQHRKEKGLDVITIADNFHNLLSTLHKTSTPQRPPLNGTSRMVVMRNLQITKGMVSQYMTIHKRLSPKVKDLCKIYKIPVLKAYNISKVRGKNQKETEELQLKEIEKIIEVKHDTTKHNINKFEQNIIDAARTGSTKIVLRDDRGFPNKYPSKLQSSDACDKPDDSPKIRTFGDSQSSQISAGKTDSKEDSVISTSILTLELSGKPYCSRFSNLCIG